MFILNLEIRNTTGEDRLFVNSNSHAFKSITDIYISKSLDETVGVDVTVENVQCMIMKCNENIKIDDNVPSPLRTHNDIPNNKVTTVYFKNPNYKDDHIFLARRLRGAESPTRVLKAQNNYDKYYKPVIGKSFRIYLMMMLIIVIENCFSVSNRFQFE